MAKISVSEHHAKLVADTVQYDTAMARSALKTQQATDKMGADVKRMRLAFQQGGYQVQDFFVQIGSGTSVARSLGQQLPQFLGIFGPAGAIAGAAVAIGATVYQIANATQKTKEAKKEVDLLVQATERLKAARDSLAQSDKNSGMQFGELDFATQRKAVNDAIRVLNNQMRNAEGSSMIASARSKDTNYTAEQRRNFEIESANKAREMVQIQEQLNGLYDQRNKLNDQEKNAWSEAENRREALNRKIQDGNALYMEEQNLIQATDKALTDFFAGKLDGLPDFRTPEISGKQTSEMQYPTNSYQRRGLQLAGGSGNATVPELKKINDTLKIIEKNTARNNNGPARWND
jgi:hypothetical protein